VSKTSDNSIFAGWRGRGKLDDVDWLNDLGGGVIGHLGWGVGLRVCVVALLLVSGTVCDIEWSYFITLLVNS